MAHVDILIEAAESLGRALGADGGGENVATMLGAARSLQMGVVTPIGLDALGDIAMNLAGGWNDVEFLRSALTILKAALRKAPCEFRRVEDRHSGDPFFRGVGLFLLAVGMMSCKWRLNTLEAANGSGTGGDDGASGDAAAGVGVAAEVAS